MPVRSFNLKLVVPRGPDGKLLREALWTTHAEVNAATRYYEERLLCLRALPYEVSASNEPSGQRMVALGEAESAALRMARAAQRANLDHDGDFDLFDAAGTDAEVLAALRDLYRLIAPDETGEGSAQAANGYISPLTDPKSQGFAMAAGKLDRPRPNWLSMADDDPELLDAAKAWYASDASLAWRTDTGSPAGWLRAARAGKPNWPALFRAKLEDLVERTASGPEGIMARLRVLRLLPLFPPFFTPRMANPSGGVTPWDRLAFRLAVAHILSWEAWCRRAVEQHTARKATLDGYRARAVTPELVPLLDRVRRYEKTCAEDMSRLGLGPSVYTLRPRQLRGWSDLKEAWKKAKDQSPETLRAILAEQQTKKRGKFGDPQVFLWLAEAAQHDLWKGGADVVSIAATLNAMQALVDRSRETATMTLPDARLHPRATQWAAEGDTNLRPYRLLDAGDGALAAKLSLLYRLDDGRLADTDVTVRLAASEQMRVQRLGKRDRKAEIVFDTGSGETLTGIVGSADMLFDRRHLGHRDAAELEAGSIGPVWLKVTVDLDPMLPDGWGPDHARFVRHFSSALGKATKAEDMVRDGARVLAVDLGLRTFAACSVFTLREETPFRPDALAFRVPLGDRTLWATHERSVHLELPGETPSRDGLQWRRLRDEEMRRMRRFLARYRRVMRLAGSPPEDRGVALEALTEARVTGDPFPFEEAIQVTLAAKAQAPQPVWDDAVTAALRELRIAMNPVVREWRHRGKERLAFLRTGKSMWAVQHLTNLRRFLQSWNLLGRATGEVRRMNRVARGVFASRLLAHLDNIKDDRLQTGADLIVRAAMGFVRDKAGCWERRFRPCDVVLFEDLSRYRMRTDRPRRENSQLMRWAHRAVPGEVAMQGALYGLDIPDDKVRPSAAFTSRFHARTLTPGIRSQPLAAADLHDPWLQEGLAKLEIDLAACRPGDLVPRDGGQVFACLRARKEGLLTIDADINAAQNLQRRFWTRHAEAFRLPCSPGQLDGKEVWVPRTMGKRLLGAMGGLGVLCPTGHDTGSCRWEPASGHKMKGLAAAVGDQEAQAFDPDAEEMTGLVEEAEVEAGRVEVFFRDPSGVVWPADLWFPAKVFWRRVRQATGVALKARLG
ncbi:type V CRISPR-associated protein Cas12b [Paracraurococcus lichenis]|uniref:Type V CRISPR-associated protein Cas12b n=1 Tax=Paracraurococcus lichenis TaxID=3064888 RepID=A0ABT9EC20_9PROT|nr:type V CRISPR-associated protein Cas12b [Paracraurococcus sp. LOR1-02]MDO9713752.1 type V CRISPR-associated protein Cas12b [Paracraurococcus sp. LOR1-02]